MPNQNAVKWFKDHFWSKIEKACKATIYPPDFIVAIACQETGEIWATARNKPGFDAAKTMALCTGDMIDDSSKYPRKAFPRNKAELLAAPDGAKMFKIAREALLSMAAVVPGYESAFSKESKIAHGFGVFQYDLQFYKVNREYFLNREYEIFENSLELCLSELEEKRKRISTLLGSHLTDADLCAIAIAYNTGGYKKNKGLKQGYKVGNKFYGEMIYDYLLLSRTVPNPNGDVLIRPPIENHAILPNPTHVGEGGVRYEVVTKTTTLRVRSSPNIPQPPEKSTKNVITDLPEGQIVRAITNVPVNNFIEIETNLGGAYIRGFSSLTYLDKVSATAEIMLPDVKSTEPTSGIVPAHLIPPNGVIIKRTDKAGAHSLNEKGAPERKGETPDELTRSIADIIAWLDVDNPGHARYKPRSGLTFCNIYAHDFCTLAGVYLPRVWWTEKALIDLSNGKEVKPKYASTLFEARANDLFRWLRDHGADFGWRQTGTADKLQQAANQGGIGVIVARRTQENRSGHITIVVPETPEEEATRGKSGLVTRPLESQAGSKNFKYGKGAKDWWKHERFAEFGFFIHA